ncbi:unnamed protein product [Rotaria socialis]|nr:unnamed protein product [Rotaria socialis]
MSVGNNEEHLSTVINNVYVEESLQKNARHQTFPWGIDPAIYLDEINQQSHIKKLLALQESLAKMAQTSSSKINQNQKDITNVTDTLETLKTMRAILLQLNPSDTRRATQFGKDITMIVTDLLSRVVFQIGQTNVHTPTFQSIIAYIRNLMETRSKHMRHPIPGSLLIAWYDLSDLMSFMQNEPEIRITNKKATQLVDLAFDTAAWTHKHLTTELIDHDKIGFKDRNSLDRTSE